MKKLLSLVTPLLLLASCTTDFDQQLGGSRTGAPDGKAVFVASTEGPSALTTKVYADENLKVLWNAGDRISIFNMTTGNAEYAFTGDDGDTAGGFEEVSEATGGADIDYVYAVYPYQAATTVSTAGVVTTVLPAEQYYKEKSFGIGSNTMVAVADENFLAFKNVGGYLSFRLYGDDISVSRITIKGNNGEKIAGKAAITMPVGGTPSIVMDENATNAVSVVCNPPVKIGTSKTDYTDFWFVIPPTTFTGGFTITVTDHMGGVYEKATTSRFTVSRNKLDWMNPIKVEPSYVGGYVDLGLPSGTKWATMNIGASTLYDDGDYFAWGEVATKDNYTWATYVHIESGQSDWKHINKYTFADGLTDGIWYDGNTFKGDNGDGVAHKCLASYDYEDDAARKKWGSTWRMPTDAEWTWLLGNCDWVWTDDYNGTGVKGMVVTSKIEGYTENSFFLPAAGVGDATGLSNAGYRGDYWSSSLYEGNSVRATAVYFSSGGGYGTYYNRSFGLSVRPVFGESEPENSNTIDGHEFVDMGNGLKWATMNVGADSPEEYGDHFAWGEKTIKSNYVLSTYFDNPSGDGLTYTKYATDKKTQLDSGDDVARAKWGSTWRMPTDADWTWLKENCNWVWTDDYNGTGKAGMVVTSNVTGFENNSIFLPAAGTWAGAMLYDDGTLGTYWSSSLYENSSRYAWGVQFNSEGVYRGYDARYSGYSVRPVSD